MHKLCFAKEGGLWYLMHLSRIFQLYLAVSFIDGGNQSTRIKTTELPLVTAKISNNIITRKVCVQLRFSLITLYLPIK